MYRMGRSEYMGDQLKGELKFSSRGWNAFLRVLTGPADFEPVFTSIDFSTKRREDTSYSLTKSKSSYFLTSSSFIFICCLTVSSYERRASASILVFLSCSLSTSFSDLAISPIETGSEVLSLASF